MSVFVTLRSTADPAKVQKVLDANPDALKAVNARAMENGAIHHRFMATVDGTEVSVVDEWETAEGFQKFFASSPEIPQLMGEAGVQGAPQVTLWNALDTPDAF